MGSPGWNTTPVLVVTTLLSNNKLSPDKNVSLPSPPVFKYVTNKTYQLPPAGLPIYDFIFAFTPDILPIITWSSKSSKYDSTLIPSLDIWILIESYPPLYLIPPPVTEAPSLKICWPNSQSDSEGEIVYQLVHVLELAILV